MKYLCNAFSLGMLPQGFSGSLEVRPVDPAEARFWAGRAQSAVGHADTARIFSTLLDREVEMARVSVKLAPGDSVLVGQYNGPRLSEGATALPEGATITWVMVTVPDPVLDGE